MRIHIFPAWQGVLLVITAKISTFAQENSLVMQAEQILERYELSKTSIRLQVLNILRHKRFAMSEQDIKTELQGEFDRSTLYRTIRAFIEKDIVHRIVDDQNKSQYVLNKALMNFKHYEQEHLHFKCQQCGKLYCLENIPVKDYSLPQGFVPLQSEFLILGICDECNKKAD